ncbi:MAG: T9SS type A sorting domain-containing protein [Bacteroidia bacterium]|nr:T9SS type A sorting domain-containing protein [Bacteroidia bacterium]
MKKFFLLSVICCSFLSAAFSQALNSHEFDMWSLSWKFDQFTDNNNTARYNNILALQLKEFDTWTNSRKFIHFYEENLVANPAPIVSASGENKPDTLSNLQHQEANQNSASRDENFPDDGLSIPGSSKINIYPNPADERINISLNYPAFTDVQITLFNSIGNIVYSSEVKDKKQVFKVIEVENMNRGIYFLEIKAEGEKTIKKIIIK